MNMPIPTNKPCLLQVAKDIRDPTCSMLGQASLGQVLEQWLQAKQSLPTQLQAQVAAECRHQQNDRSSTGPLARQHKFRLATHVILAADPNLADHIARVGTPLNLAPLHKPVMMSLSLVCILLCVHALTCVAALMGCVLLILRVSRYLRCQRSFDGS